MCYTVGHAFFGKGAYDAEIARGCCITNYKKTGLGIQVIGGASKLWKAILNYYEDKNLDNKTSKLTFLFKIVPFFIRAKQSE